MLFIQQGIHKIERSKTKKGIWNNPFDIEQKETGKSKQKCEQRGIVVNAKD